MNNQKEKNKWTKIYKSKNERRKIRYGIAITYNWKHGIKNP